MITKWNWWKIEKSSFSLLSTFFKGAALTEREEAIWFNFKIFWQKEILVWWCRKLGSKEIYQLAQIFFPCRFFVQFCPFFSTYFWFLCPFFSFHLLVFLSWCPCSLNLWRIVWSVLLVLQIIPFSPQIIPLSLFQM